jgi:hypothetical protein
VIEKRYDQSESKSKITIKKTIEIWVVLFMAIATTLIAPPFLKWLYANEVAARAEIGPPDASG